MNEAWLRIRAVRKKLRLTQVDFAAMIGVTRAAVANWETGHAMPDMPNLIRIAKEGGVGLGWLVTGQENEGSGCSIAVEWPPPTDITSGDTRVKGQQELQLLLLFRALKAEQRRALLLLLGAAKGADP